MPVTTEDQAETIVVTEENLADQVLLLKSNSPDVFALIGGDLFEASKIKPEVFIGSVQAALSKPEYLIILGNIKETNPLGYSIAITAGPAMILDLLGVMLDAGMIDKKEVVSKAKIKTSKIRWWKAVMEEIMPAAHAAAVLSFNEKLPSLHKLGMPSTVLTLPDFIKATGKAGINVTVDSDEDIWTSTSEDGQHTALASLSMGFRADFNVNSRNANRLQKKAEDEAAAALAALEAKKKAATQTPEEMEAEAEALPEHPAQLDAQAEESLEDHEDARDDDEDVTDPDSDDLIMDDDDDDDDREESDE